MERAVELFAREARETQGGGVMLHLGSVAGSLNRGLDHQGRTLLGGDASFALMQREATPEERSFLDRRGRVSAAAIVRAMAHAPSGELALVDRLPCRTRVLFV